MKTIDEIKHIVARQKGFSSWKNMYVVLSASRDSKFFDYENEVATEYAKQCCEEQIKACAKEATASIDYVDFHDFSKGIEGCHVDEYSILETPNVVTIKP